MSSVAVRVALISWTAPTQNTDGSTLTNLAGFRIRYGNAPGVYTQPVVTINNPSTTQWTLPLAPGIWYFAIAAFTATGESVNATEVIKTIN